MSTVHRGTAIETLVLSHVGTCISLSGQADPKPAAGEMKVAWSQKRPVFVSKDTVSLDPSAFRRLVRRGNRSNRGIGTSKDSGASPICSPAYRAHYRAAGCRCAA
ncbi:hypothetical protein CABS01_02255 [Colletotrichum abscissum]|uniref:uncharacterized protein n=1 Tax=Colletotrichum abscissum TaxID=1671311 RepID=UPI0027D6643A|nr:uncharacterized protein CABS01_02255 [Colletotrichum abscissum]KAK1488625.1 hypothetical protein CABS01_02255 [Colletotrichum abscissum]